MTSLAEDSVNALSVAHLPRWMLPRRMRAPLEFLVLVDESEPAAGLACVPMNEVRGPHPVLKAAAEYARAEGRSVCVRAVCAEEASRLMRR